MENEVSMNKYEGGLFIEEKHTANDQKSTREKELESKGWDHLNKEERAELAGLRQFPNNPRNADLAKRSMLKLLSPEEQQELQNISKLIERGKLYSHEILTLLERSESGDPTVVEVVMNAIHTVDVLPFEEEKVIWTHSLNGCSSLLLVGEDNRDGRHVVLSHFNPLALKDCLKKIESTLRHAGITKQARAIIFISGESGSLNEEPEETKAVASTLQGVVANVFGNEKNIQIEVYPRLQEDGVKDHGTIVVHVPAKGKGDVRYQTWYSEGTITQDT